jgi:hypothetical protein
LSLDPEGLTLTAQDTLVLTSEGIATRHIAPFVREFDLSGQQVGELAVPGYFDPSDDTTGVRQNLGFEAAAVAPDGQQLFVGTENALVQDGPAATTATGSPARILRYHLGHGGSDRQYVYPTDPVTGPSTVFTVNGLVELLPLNNEFLLSMERSFSVGAPGTGNEIKLYRVALPGATDVRGVPSLAGLDVRPAQKTLLFDLGSLGIPLDNVEGMTLGPKLADGRQSLVLVSDNNFAASQFTQFLLFALS